MTLPDRGVTTKELSVEHVYAGGSVVTYLASDTKNFDSRKKHFWFRNSYRMTMDSFPNTSQCFTNCQKHLWAYKMVQLEPPQTSRPVHQCKDDYIKYVVFPQNEDVFRRMAISKTCTTTKDVIYVTFLLVSRSSLVKSTNLKILVVAWHSFWRQNSGPNFWNWKLGQTLWLQAFYHMTIKFFDLRFKNRQRIFYFSYVILDENFPFCAGSFALEHRWLASTYLFSFHLNE